MSEYELDRWALLYLSAVARCDLDAVEKYWGEAEGNAELEDLLAELDDADAADTDTQVSDRVIATVRMHLPTARMEDGPLALASVAEELSRLPPPLWPAAAHTFNERLRQETRAVPLTESLSTLLAWAQMEFPESPDAYWKAFRNAAMRLAATRSDPEYGMAARSAKRRPS